MRGSALRLAAGAWFALLLSAAEMGGAESRVKLVERLLAESDLVVRARLSSTESYRTADGSAIMTRLTFAVAQRLYPSPDDGAGREEAIAVLVPGGEVGGTRLIVVDGPTFDGDEEAVLFLQREEEIEPAAPGAAPAPPYFLTSLRSGKMTISRRAGDAVRLRPSGEDWIRHPRWRKALRYEKLLQLIAAREEGAGAGAGEEDGQ